MFLQFCVSCFFLSVVILAQQAPEQRSLRLRLVHVIVGVLVGYRCRICATTGIGDAFVLVEILLRRIEGQIEKERHGGIALVMASYLTRRFSLSASTGLFDQSRTTFAILASWLVHTEQQRGARICNRAQATQRSNLGGTCRLCSKIRAILRQHRVRA